VIEVSVLAQAIAMSVRAGEDNDEGALAGSRADERQKLLGLRSQALAAKLAAVAAFIGLTIAVAVKAAWGWPFLVVLAVAGFGYLLGLSNYGVAEEDPAEDANAGHQAHCPVSH
jgi:fatty acid desaturase